MTKREKIYWTHIKWCKRFNKLGVGYSAKSYPAPDKDGRIRFKKGTIKIPSGEPFLDGLFMPLGPSLNADGTPRQVKTEYLNPVPWEDLEADTEKRFVELMEDLSKNLSNGRE